MPRPRIPGFTSVERRAAAIALPWAIMTAIGLVSVWVPPYPQGWIVPVLATLIAIGAGLMYVLSQRFAEGGWLELVTAFVPFLYVAVVRHGTGAATHR
ncbi:hypothetical protein [Nocardioides piscis]|uniref:Uncharacterized protein n=1 Tax=Nocardioides piscis TaxID=2714938 RepID=A0A6G7YDL1_9ACTN|nr:hypothetical protein [Nocardioides piscis]QIK74697.1 hypothetical protein G7071_03940 [Nocardioides piscis]